MNEWYAGFLKKQQEQSWKEQNQKTQEDKKYPQYTAISNRFDTTTIITTIR